MSTIERLTAHLEEQARAGIAGAGVEAVMDRGRRHQRNRIIGLTAGAVVLVGAMIVGAVALQSVVDERPATADRDVVDGDASPATAAELEWVAAESPVGFSSDLVAGVDAIYALTTAPGVTGDVPLEQREQAIFTSADGEMWTSTVLPRDLWVQDLATGDGALYAIGTAPGVTPWDGVAMNVDVGVSDDGAESWSYTDLPLSAAPPEGLDFQVSTSTSIAAGDAVVAAVTTQFHAGYESMLALVPDDIRSETLDLRATAEGIQAIDIRLVEAAAQDCDMDRGVVRLPADAGGAATTTSLDPAGASGDGDVLPEACDAVRGDPGEFDGFVVWEATWDELGVGGGDPFVTEMFVSDDGERFEAVESPFTGESAVRVFTVDGGFVAGTAYGDIELLHSGDGRSWEQLVGVPPLTELHAVGSVGDRIVVVGGLSGKPVVVSATRPGGPWSTHDLAGLLADIGMTRDVWVQAADVGALGAAVSVAAWSDTIQMSQAAVLHSADLESWAALPSEELVGARSVYYERVAVSPEAVLAQAMLPSDAPGGRSLRLTAIGSPAS